MGYQNFKDDLINEGWEIIDLRSTIEFRLTIHIEQWKAMQTLTFSQMINFFKQGYSANHLTRLIKNSLTKSLLYDLESKVEIVKYKRRNNNENLSELR